MTCWDSSRSLSRDVREVLSVRDVLSGASFALKMESFFKKTKKAYDLINRNFDTDLLIYHFVSLIYKT